jgi:DNA-directed RNA polymerase specialized sigma24 family protein
MDAKLRRAARAVDVSLARRDTIIREAASKGLSYRRIAELTGLTFGRVGQIVRGE